MAYRVNSIYIMLEDGRCIFNQFFTPVAPPKNLITGMFTAVQGFVVEFTGSYPTVLSTDRFTFYFQKRGPLTIVLNTSDTMEQPKELNDIGLRFMQKFGDRIDSWKGDDNYFSDFSSELQDLLGIEQTTVRIDPSEPITAMTLLTLAPKYQQLAKILISQREASSAKLAEELEENEFNTRLKLEEMVENGYLGRYQLENAFIYFTQ